MFHGLKGQLCIPIAFHGHHMADKKLELQSVLTVALSINI